MDISNASVVIYIHKNKYGKVVTDAIGETELAFAGSNKEFGSVSPVYIHKTQTTQSIEHYGEDTASMAIPVEEIIGTFICEERTGKVYEFMEVSDYTYKIKDTETGDSLVLSTFTCTDNQYERFVDKFSLNSIMASEAFTKSTIFKEKYHKLRMELKSK